MMIERQKWRFVKYVTDVYVLDNFLKIFSYFKTNNSTDKSAF